MSLGLMFGFANFALFSTGLARLHHQADRKSSGGKCSRLCLTDLQETNIPGLFTHLALIVLWLFTMLSIGIN